MREYENYINTKKAIRDRQRAELELELVPQLKALGYAIRAEQASGRRISDIEQAMGSRNRTLIYKALKATEGLSQPKEQAELSYTVDKSNGTVTINGKSFTLTKSNGIFEPADEWLGDVENKSLYQAIMRELNS